MIYSTSEKSPMFTNSLKRSEILVLDIETLDSKILQLWDEPIISFSMSFPTNVSTNWEAPTICYSAESPEEECELLLLLHNFLVKNRDMTIAGHNVSWQFKNGLPWKMDMICRKIFKRGLLYDIDFSFVKTLKVFDSMDEAFERYDHSCHKRYFNGREQKVLRCEHIEQDFDIVRPHWLPKLGSQVRQLYEDYLATGNNSLLQTINLYNSCDTLVESIITKIFAHCMTCNSDRSGVISPAKKCSHIPGNFLIDSNPTWKRIVNSKLLPYAGLTV